MIKLSELDFSYRDADIDADWQISQPLCHRDYPHVLLVVMRHETRLGPNRYDVDALSLYSSVSWPLHYTRDVMAYNDFLENIGGVDLTAGVLVHCQEATGLPDKITEDD